MDEDLQREIARRGGRAVSKNRSHMAAIGRRGGEEISRDRDYMAMIGRRGGQRSHSSGSERQRRTSRVVTARRTSRRRELQRA
jgi:general stress protein YciG